MRWRASVALVGLLLVAACSAGNDAEAPRAEASPARLMRALSGTDERAARAARDSILASRDRRFVAVFVELMRAAEVGLVAADRYPGYVRALQQLSGKRFGSDWPAWVRWYASTEMGFSPAFYGTAPPSGFAWRRCNGAASWSTGPSLDNPHMVEPAKAGYLVADEPVFGISQNGDSRATRCESSTGTSSRTTSSGARASVTRLLHAVRRRNRL